MVDRVGLLLPWLMSCNVGRVFNGSGKAVDKGPQVLAEDYLDIQGLTHVLTALLITLTRVRWTELSQPFIKSAVDCVTKPVN